MMPKVSIVSPTYNHAKYISECIDSALTQNYPNLEIIVVDDGSTDNTPAILKSFSDKIRYIRQDNRGIGAARNTGIRAAKGDLIAWLSSDDTFLPDKIAAQVQMFQQNPALGIIYTDYIVIDTQGKELGIARCPQIPSERFVREILVSNPINSSTILVKKECFNKVGYCNEKLKVDEDGHLLLRIAKHFKFGHIAQPLGQYRVHHANMSRKRGIVYRSIESVRLEALSSWYTPQELFPDMGNDLRLIAKGYEYLSFRLAIHDPWLMRSANCAIQKSIELDGFSFERCLLSLFFKLMIIVRPFAKPVGFGFVNKLSKKLSKLGNTV